MPELSGRQGQMSRWISHVAAGLLTNAVCQLIHLSLIHRIREQARSYI